MAYYLKSNGFVPMLCACDTFRAGAVEQLRVHAQSLELPLYEKGYGRDAAGIATDGIAHAKQMGYDCVLVDTAGRMQDNEPLMRALSKLVNVNSPDLVLFVGEALVGNEASPNPAPSPNPNPNPDPNLNPNPNPNPNPGPSPNPSPRPRPRPRPRPSPSPSPNPSPNPDR